MIRVAHFIAKNVGKGGISWDLAQICSCTILITRCLVMLGAVAVFLIRDPDSVRSVYPYPDQDSESGSMRAKFTHQKKLRNFMF